MRLAMAMMCAAALCGAAFAQGKTFVLSVDEALAESGLIDYVVPRFALKHGIRPSVVVGDAASADVVIGVAETVEDGRAAFHTEAPEANYAVALLDGGEPEHAGAFVDWLTGEIGQNTVTSYEAPDGTVFLPGTKAVKVTREVVVEGDADEGDRLAHFHCGRCHVVSEKNRMGGIGSAPSFAALRAIPGWEDKFLAFWSVPPHPSFTFVEGVTEMDPARPPHIAPVEITLDEIDAIFAYTAGIPPKDLGAQIDVR